LVLAALAMGALLWLAAPLVLAIQLESACRRAGARRGAADIGRNGGLRPVLALLGVIRWGQVVNAIWPTTGSGLRELMPTWHGTAHRACWQQ